MAGSEYTKTARWHANHPPAKPKKPKVRVAWLIIGKGGIVMCGCSQKRQAEASLYANERIVRVTYTLPKVPK
jgi:hypothetical protein